MPVSAANLLEPQFRPATSGDADCLRAVRAAAFAPVFAAFRAMLGDDLYELVQRREDEAQQALLDALIAGQDGWALHVARLGTQTIGFVALRCDPATRVGEVGLNAVDPLHARRGVGTAMYRYALGCLRAAGMGAATVATGGDASHAPARRAYTKAGFDKAIPSVWMCCSLAGLTDRDRS
jgi:GNAT superfamily N-acetyltransferase